MEIVDPLRMSRASYVLQSEVEKHGAKARIGHDFFAFRHAIAELEDRELSDQFNLDYETLKPTESFWLICRDQNDKLIAAVAAKLENLGPMTAPEYWRMQYPRVYKANAGGPIEFLPEQSRAASALRGRLVYIGDAYCDREYRKSSLAPAMGQLAMLTSYQMWGFDACYAFIHNSGMVKGIATNHGFCHQHAIAIRWKSNPKQLLRDNWLVWNGGPDILDLVDRLCEHFP